ncbi:MAG TPA: Hpt domain-containing protein, partial [Ktedonobacterales bacterium]
MSDDTVFARFIHEMRTLLTAIEAHCDTLSDAAPSERRPHGLREIARLAHAASALAEAFAVDDLRALAEALAEVTSIAADQAKQSGEAEPLAPLGVRDTLSYLQWRVERLAAVGQAEPPTARDLALIGRLNQALATALEVNPLANTFTDASELTLAEVALVQSFSSAPLRKRDPQADARLLARMAETPAFVAQTASGAGVPVFGGMTEEEFDTVPPEMKRIFVNEAPADLRELSQLVLAFERQPEELRILEKMAFLAHKIKGGAATMGFVGFSDIAVLLEEVVTNAPGTPLSASPAFLPGLGRFLDLLEQGLAAAAQLEEPAPALLDDARRLRDALLHPHAMHTGQPTPAMADADRSGGRERPADQELVLRIEAGKLDMLMNQLSALAANRGAVNRNRSEIAHAQAEMQAALARLREKSAQIADGHPLTYDNLIAVAQS